MQAAKDIVLSEKPVIMDDSSNLDPLLLEKLLAQVGLKFKMQLLLLPEVTITMTIIPLRTNRRSPPWPLCTISQLTHSSAGSGWL